MLPRSCCEAGSKTDSLIGLTDDQWVLIEHFFPNKQVSPQGGRPERDNRACLEGVLWVLVTGARWKDLPPEFPSYPTCWWRFKQWTESGAFLKAWNVLIQLMIDLKQIDLSSLLGDGTFAPSKKGVRM